MHKSLRVETKNFKNILLEFFADRCIRCNTWCNMFTRSPLNFGFEGNHLREVRLIKSNIIGVDVILPTFVLSHSCWFATVTAHLGNFIISKSPANQIQGWLIEEFRTETRK